MRRSLERSRFFNTSPNKSAKVWNVNLKVSFHAIDELLLAVHHEAFPKSSLLTFVAKEHDGTFMEG
jgi:hypothetical protein